MAPLGYAAIVVVAVVALALRDRIPPRVSILVSLASLAGLGWWSFAESDPVPAILGVLIALSTAGIRLGLINDGGSSRRDAYPRGQRQFAEPARYVRGPLATSWPRGEMHLSEDRVRFVLPAGDEIFSVSVADITGLHPKRHGRGDLEIEVGDNGHTIAFGREQLHEDDRAAATHHWVTSIRERQSEGQRSGGATASPR